jgi:D-glycero-alpha-D-manno-heptose-7-phosphate kinase
MLIGRAPVRVSFSGGGTDLPAYYTRFGGLVLSAAIDKYVYTIVTAGHGEHVQVISADHHVAMAMPSPRLPHLRVSVAEKEHAAVPLPAAGGVQSRNGNGTAGLPEPPGELQIPYAVLRHFQVAQPLNLFIASEVPPGTGLGSSAATCVSVINVIAALHGLRLPAHAMAELAFTIESDQLHAPVGKQDQFAAAYGGVNCITFNADGSVGVERVRAAPGTLARLNRRLMLFYTGTRRSGWAILQEQRTNTAQDEGPALEALHEIKRLALEMKAALEADELDAFGDLLHRAWEHKKRLASGITTSQIDRAYASARSCGATGGKITGAGGGGYLLLYCREEQQPAVEQALGGLGLRRLHFHFDYEGAQVLLHTPLLPLPAPWQDAADRAAPGTPRVFAGQGGERT